MNCPRCQNELKVEIIKGYNYSIEVDNCDSCGGTWLDKGEIAPIQRIVEPVIWEKRELPSKKEQYETMLCPRCDSKTPMEKIPHPRDRYVIFDQCVDCSGIWLDQGEITAIQKENWFSVIGSLFSKMI
ncbi:zf-TFIIB domain-containing protein [Saprospiraceae bacterium]|nr:zf-TFIIB domain-containing protein [Saprospiraceae bacterium]